MSALSHRWSGAVCAVVSCAPPARSSQSNPGIESSYLLVSAGDADEADSDFLAVIDLRSESADLGKAIETMPTGMNASMPHHTEYALPPVGELLFLNAHHHEMTMLVDVSTPRALRTVKTFTPPPPLRFPHDYSRTPTGWPATRAAHLCGPTHLRCCLNSTDSW